MKHSIDDTIAAIATPTGVGGIGVVRISGPDSRKIAAAIFEPGKDVSPLETHRIYHGWVRASGLRVDEVLLSFMAGPNSFTGEDVVEISCHGGGFVLKKVLGLVVGLGARLAEKGEFSKRAFLNGRIDLSKAEAIADLIGAKSERGLRAAAAQLGGEISRSVGALRQLLLDLLSAIEASVDFPDDVAALSRTDFSCRLDSILAGVDSLLATAGEGRLAREGVRLAIIGKPNVGKSSLLNRLLDTDRAIVSEVPGTTRDTIEEGLALNGLSFVLVDTAGIRGPKDKLEAEGVERTSAEIRKADIVMIVLDASSDLSTEDKQALSVGLAGRAVVVLNKIDLGGAISLNGQAGKAPTFKVSALTGEGLPELKLGLVDAALGGNKAVENEPPALINARHREALCRAREALYRASDGLSGGVSPDLLAIDLKEAGQALGEVSGLDVSDQIIENIFQRFCVGK